MEDNENPLEKSASKVLHCLRDEEKVVCDSLSLLQSYASDNEVETSIEKYDITNGDYECDFTRHFTTDLVFYSRDELTSWCKDVGKSLGMVIVIKKSDKAQVGRKARISYWCERSGIYQSHNKKNSHKTTIKDTGTKKCGCLFLLKGVKLVDDDQWKVQVVCGQHNHLVDTNTTFEGHSYVGRLSSSEEKLVIDLCMCGAKPREILRVLKKNNPLNATTIRTIYNFKAKHRICELQGRTQMQQLLKLLNDHQYVEFHRRDECTDEVMDLFFSHPQSVQLAQCFPEVMVLDCTYKTNRYCLPLLEIVGISSTGKTFSIAYAYLQHEREENFLWALQCLKDILHTSTTPSVFITDRDLAVMNAIAHLFPEANHLLCRWHIMKNIEAKGKGYFEKKEQWNIFKKSLKCVVMAPTIEFYNEEIKKFKQDHAQHKKLLDYIDNSWLSKYKERFVSAWTNSIMHFGNLTSNRAESSHSTLKRYLGSSQGNLTSNWSMINNLLVSQFVALRDSFAKSLSFSKHKHRISDFNQLRGFISRHALEKILLEKQRGEHVGIDSSKCGCVIKRTHGLPCAHEIVEYKREGRSIPLSSIHPRWRRLVDKPVDLPKRSLDLKPEMETLKTRFESATEEQKVMILKVMKELGNPSTTYLQEPFHKKVPRGRTAKKRFSSKSKDSTKRDPSSFEYAMTREEQQTQQSSNKTTQKKQPKRMKMSLKDLTDEESIQEILKLFNPKIQEHVILTLENVAPDGHCGYRACAELLQLDKENGWKDVRAAMLDELRDHKDLYTDQLGGMENYNKLVMSLNFFMQLGCRKKYWMQFPEMGPLLSTTFNCTLCVFSPEQSFTYLPLRIGPTEHVQIICIALVDNNHFLKVIRRPGSPIPRLVPWWYNIRYPDAARWELVVKPMIDDWEARVGCP